MARYGGGVEDFNNESAKLRELRAQREAVLRTEVQQTAAAESLGQAEGASARQTNIARRARQESAEVDARAARVTQQGTRATQADTAAIARNTQARRAQAEVARSSVSGGWTKEAIRDQQAYIDAMQRGATAEAKVIRQRLAAQGLVTKTPPNVPGLSARLQPSSRTAMGTATWEREFAKALESPNFRFTPNPRALAEEMASVVNPKLNLQQQAVAAGRTQADKARISREYEARQAALRPIAQQRLAAMSPGALREFQSLASLPDPFGNSHATYTNRAEGERAKASQQRITTRLVELARETEAAVAPAAQVARREEQAAAATEQVVAAKKQEAAAATEAAAAERRYTRERTAKGKTIFRDPDGNVIRRSAGHEYSHVVVDPQGQPVSFHNSRQLAQKAMGSRRNRGGDRIEQIYENEAQAAERAANDTSFAARKDAEVRAKVQAAKERAAQEAEREVAAQRETTAAAQVEAADMREEAARMAAIRRQRETIAAAEVTAREGQAAEASRSLIRHPELYGRAGVPTLDVVGQAGRDRSLRQAAVESAPVRMSRLEQAELAYTSALNRQANAYRRLATSPNDLHRQHAMAGAADEVTATRERRDALRAELSARRKQIEAINADASAEAQAAVVAREHVAATAFNGGPGAGIVLHPDDAVRRAYATQQFPKYERVGSPGAGISNREALAQKAEAEAVKISSAAHEAKVASIQAEAAGLGRLTAAQEAYLASMKPEAQIAYHSLRADSVVASGRIAEMSGRTSSALQREGAALGSVSQAMHKHGALTSEFILATARGETTLRQLGNQAIVTAGKFGGWTIAATALFGAASAIGKIGHGAIESSVGVQQLRRVMDNVDSDKAQQAFSGLSRQFNLPMNEVTDAVYRMAQRFHSLPDAVEASKAALYSLKTGEVDVATSTSNLLAIVNGFGLGAQDLTRVYDQINQAQNRFGINIGDTEAGLAKAGGTFKNAGGDLSYLLALFVAIHRATNRSGQEIGTAISRAPSQLRRAGAVEFLKTQGIDADPRNVQKTIQNAMEAVRKHPGLDTRGIAQSILGNQYARLLDPVLRDQRNLNAAIKDTSPEASKNSAQRELAKVLREAREQIQQMGNELQRLGAALNRAGALNLFGGLLRALNTGLSLVTRMVEMFDKLPAPVRQALSLVVELGIAMRLAQRFGVTNRLAGGSLGFLANPERQFAVRTRQGLASAAQAARDRQEQAQRATYNSAANFRAASRNAEIADARVAALQKDIDADRGGTEAVAAHAAAMERQIVAAERAAAAERDLLAARAAAADARLVTQEMESAEAASRKVHPTQMRAYAESHGYGVPRESITPSALGLEDDAALAASSRVPGNFQTAAPKELTDRAVRVNSSMTRWWNSLTPVGTQMSLFEKEAQRWGYAGRGVDRIARGGIGAITSATNFVSRASGSVRGLGARFANFTASLSSMDIALVALIGGEMLSQAAQGLQSDLDRSDRWIDQYRGNTAGNQRALADRVRSQRAKRGETNGEYSRDNLSTINDYFNPVELVGHTIPEYLRGDYESAQDRRARIMGEQEAAQQNMDWIRRDQGRRAKQGKALPNLTADQAVKRINDDQKLRRQGILTLGQFDDAMAKHAIEAQTLIEGTTQAQVQKVRQALAAANQQQGGQAAFAASLKALDPKHLDKIAQSVATVAGDVGGTPRALGNLRTVFLEYQRRFDSGDGGIDAMATLAQARDAYFQALQASIQSDLDADLLDARSEHDRRRAYENAAAAYERQFAKLPKTPENRRREHAIRGQLRDTSFQDRQAGREAALALAQSRTADPAEQAANAVREAQRQVRDAQNTYHSTKSRPYRQALAALNQARQQQAQAVLSDVEADNALLIARAGDDPVDQARAAVTAAQNTLQAMQANSSRLDPNAIKQQQAQVITAQTALRHAQSQEATDLAGLYAQLAQARSVGDPVGAARAAQHAAQVALANATTRKDRLQALIAIAQADQQLVEAFHTVSDARYALLESLTQDPVKIANLERRKTLADLSGTKGVDRTTALAQRNQALTGFRNAKLESREGDIDFEKEMGRITTQDAIARYRALLQWHHLSKAQRQDIQRKIHSLEQESESEASGFNLDVSNIRMPTLYDVRKAWDPIRKQHKASARAAAEQYDPLTMNEGRYHRAGIVNDVRAHVSHLHDSRADVQATITVIVKDKGAAAEVYSAIDRAMGTHVRARLRSKGMR